MKKFLTTAVAVMGVASMVQAGPCHKVPQVETYAHPTLFRSQAQQLVDADSVYVTGAKAVKPHMAIGISNKQDVFVAGYAKDVIGVKSLTWQWGKESGEFELTPGNPYWVKEVDSRGMSGKQDFIVTATDTMGNVVVVKKGIKLNQEADKPVVTINYPGNGVNVEAEDGSLFVRNHGAHRH